jgi:hypothetical protein
LADNDCVSASRKPLSNSTLAPTGLTTNADVALPLSLSLNAGPRADGLNYVCIFPFFNISSPPTCLPHVRPNPLTTPFGHKTRRGKR